MPYNEGSNRFNFWSSFNAKPKPKHKFLLRFGNNAIFTNEQQYDLNLKSEQFKTLGLGATPFFGNTSWLVKSVTRPSFDGQNLKGLRDATGKVISFEMPKPEDIKWQPMTIKMVNASSHTFWPSEMLNDLDWLLGMVIDKSGYRYDAEQRQVFFGYDNNLQSDNFAQPMSQRMLQNRQLFEPLQIIDLSTDYLPDKVSGVNLSTGENTFNPPFGNPISNSDITATKGDTTVTFNPLKDQQVFPVGVWDIRDPYLISISFGENNYENDNGFIEYDMKLGYQWAVYTSYNTDDPMAAEVLSKSKKQ